MSTNPMRLVLQPDGQGGMRHVLVAANDLPQPGRRRRARVVPDPIQASGEASAQTLRQFIERIERIDCEIAEMQADRQDVLSEARGQGFDTPTMLKIIGLRKKEKHVLDEEEALFETYRTALGLN